MLTRLSLTPGRTRFDRLSHIGRTSTVLCVDALKAAVAEAKSGKDVDNYRNAVETLREVAPDEPEAQLDKNWLDERAESNKKKTLELETQLRGYRNNLIRESVRVSFARAEARPSTPPPSHTGHGTHLLTCNKPYRSGTKNWDATSRPPALYIKR